MTNTEQIRFKQDYMEKLALNSRKVILTTSENQRHDLWAMNVFGDVEKSFMFGVLILNPQHAMSNGYLIVQEV